MSEVGSIAVVLLVLGLPVLVLAGLQWWSMRLVRRSAAPRWVRWGVPFYVVVVLGGAAVGLIESFKAVAHVSPADKATILAASISEAMNAGAAGCLPLTVAWIGVLSFFAFRRR